MHYYIIIDGIEYSFSEAVLINVGEEISKYIYLNDNKNYININKMIEENQYQLLKAIYDRCNSFIGMILTELDQLEEFNKLGSKYRILDYLSNDNHKKGNEARACQLLVEGIKLSLEPYKNVIDKENKKNITTK